MSPLNDEGLEKGRTFEAKQAKKAKSRGLMNGKERKVKELRVLHLDKIYMEGARGRRSSILKRSESLEVLCLGRVGELRSSSSLKREAEALRGFSVRGKNENWRFSVRMKGS